MTTSELRDKLKPLIKQAYKEKIRDKGEVRFGAYDEDGNPICYSHESLWEYLENYCKPVTVKKSRFK